MKTISIPLAGSLTNRNISVLDATFATTDQRFENCYPELTSNPVTGERKLHLYKRLGTLHSATAGAGYTALEGGAVVLGRSGGITGVMSFLSGTTLKLYNTSATLLGTSIAGITSAGALISETLISGVSNIVIQTFKAADGFVHAWFLPDGGAFTEIVSANYPANQTTPLYTVGAAAHAGGYMFVMDYLGNVWNSDINSLANWTATSVFPANAYADGGSGVCRYGDYIAAFGTGSIELLKNVGNPSGSPLSRAVSFNGIGCLSKNDMRAYINVGNDVYFIGIESDPGRYGIYKLNGTAYPVKISTPAVDRFLNANGSVRIAGVFNLHAMTHLLLYSGTTIQPCYCIDTNTWWYMKASSGQTSWNCALGVGGLGYLTTGQVSGKGIYRTATSAPTYQDDGTAFSAVVQTGPIDLGKSKDRTIFSRIGITGDVTAGSTVTVEYSDDDYGSWTTWGAVDMSSMQSMRYGIMQGGSAFRRDFRLTHSANTAFRSETLDIGYQ